MYKNDAAGIASAAMEEVEIALVGCLHELERLSFMSIGSTHSHEVKAWEVCWLRCCSQAPQLKFRVHSQLAGSCWWQSLGQLHSTSLQMFLKLVRFQCM